MSTTYFVGQRVETRKGKVGVVVAIDDAADPRTVDVKFGGKVFTMRQTQVMSARTAEKIRSYRTPNYYR